MFGPYRLSADRLRCHMRRWEWLSGECASRQLLGFVTLLNRWHGSIAAMACNFIHWHLRWGAAVFSLGVRLGSLHTNASRDLCDGESDRRFNCSDGIAGGAALVERLFRLGDRVSRHLDRNGGLPSRIIRGSLRSCDRSNRRNLSRKPSMKRWPANMPGPRWHGNCQSASADRLLVGTGTKRAGCSHYPQGH